MKAEPQGMILSKHFSFFFLCRRCFLPSRVFQIICLLAVLTGVLPAVADESSLERKLPPNLFLEAENLFHSGDFFRAQFLYQEYLAGNPRGEHSHHILFRLGTIDQQNRSFATALKYYKMVLERFPDPLLSHEVRFAMAQCYFGLERYDEAEALFRRSAASHPDQKRKWAANIYLGKIDETRFDYEKAISKLKDVYIQSDVKGVQDEARQLINRIIDENLSRATLVRLLRKYHSGFPVDQILLKLISIYREERNIEQLQAALSGFLHLFPEHPHRSKIETGLERVKENVDRKTRIGAVLPLTGKMALTGQQVLQGVQLAVNQSGLTQEGKLELVIRDSAAQPVERVVEELAADPDVIGIIGPVLSNNVKQVTSIADRYRVPVFTPTASLHGLSELSPYFFRNALTRGVQGKYIAEYAVNMLRLRRFAVLFPLESYGFELKDAFTREIELLGGEVITVVPYERSQADFKRQILEIGGLSDDKLEELVQNQLETSSKSPSFGQEGAISRPRVEAGLWSGDEVENLKVSLELSYDAIFLPGFYDKVGLIASQLAFYNVDTVTLLGARGWNSPELIKIAGNYIRKGYFVDGFYVNSKRPEVNQFVTQFKTAFAEEPNILSAQSYDAARMFIQIIRSGARNRLQVRDHLFSIREFQGVSGRTTILPTGEADKNLFILKINEKRMVEDN
jgi:ABC-type branched-subunit amino acid transport system substrate-binding protein|tara:strand:+ start:463 stop:2511 length:2049 start_codon:yes stop_codon:yes gene_type:complete